MVGRCGSTDGLVGNHMAVETDLKFIAPGHAEAAECEDCAVSLAEIVVHLEVEFSGGTWLAAVQF